MHAVRSLGAVAGSLAGAATVSWDLAGQFVCAATVAAVLAAVAVCGLLPDPKTRFLPSRSQTRGQRATTRHAVMLLAAMAFFASLVEDAPASWGGIYLQSVGAGSAVAASAYAALSAGELVGRQTNDRVVVRLGWAGLIRMGTLISAVALTVVLALHHPTMMLAALVVAGAGISAVFPGAYATAGALPTPATAMAQVSFAGNAGWLLVSPIIGTLATLLGLPLALGLLPLAAMMIAALAGVTRRAGHSTATPPDGDLQPEPRDASQPGSPQT